MNNKINKTLNNLLERVNILNHEGGVVAIKSFFNYGYDDPTSDTGSQMGAYGSDG